MDVISLSGRRGSRGVLAARNMTLFRQLGENLKVEAEVACYRGICRRRGGRRSDGARAGPGIRASRLRGPAA